MSEDYSFGEMTVEGWIADKCDAWRDHYESTYAEDHEEYYRLWRGIWNPNDRLRDSERSRLISPALQQAVESSVAEVEEATFGRGKWFDIKDDLQDQDKNDIAMVRAQLEEDMGYVKARKNIAECVLNAAVYGTGIGEIVLDEVKEIRPAMQPVMEGAMTAIGVTERDRMLVKIRPILPQNFLIDPVAVSIEEALGVAIDEFVPLHQVQAGIDAGIYFDVDIQPAAPDEALEPDQDLTTYNDDKVRLTKYYGKVPRELLESDNEIDVELDTKDTYVEVIAVIANGDTLLKLEANPYMMQDRPVVAFQWDIVPSRFWGRGVCEKGYNSQKALDTELRARIDSLALTVHPMMAVDASRLPRGAKMEIRPGKTLLTNGNPAEILQPFKFGATDNITFEQGRDLMQMVQMATGAIDTAGMPSFAGSEATAAGISMSLGAIIKRHKRTLINFHENFLVPFVTKAAHRYMQFVPELYPAKDFKFVAASTLGIIAREYEVTQLVQLLQTMSPESPMYPLLIESIVDNMNLSNREQIIQKIREANQPNPEMQQMQMAKFESDMAFQAAQTAALQGQAQEAMARVTKYQTETAIMPEELQLEKFSAVSKAAAAMDETKKVDQVLKLTDLELKNKAINNQAAMAMMKEINK
jgi:hypothetical protein